MKANHLLLLTFVLIVITACNKTGDVKPTPTLLGKWSLVSDSVAYGTTTVYTQSYEGLTGDYFDFRANGKCYIKEGTRYDTLGYSMLNDTTVSIENFNFSLASSIKPFTLHMATIYPFGKPVAGGIDNRVVNLRR